jgi:hypothetical protein
MSIELQEPVSSEISLSSEKRNRPNLLQFLSSANETLHSPAEKNIHLQCNILYVEIQNNKNPEIAKKKLTDIYRNNSSFNGTHLSDEYINYIISLNLSTNQLSLYTLYGLVGNSIFDLVYNENFNEKNGLSLLNSINKFVEDNANNWVLNLTFEMSIDTQYKASINKAIDNKNGAELKKLLEQVSGVVSKEAIDSIVSSLPLWNKETFSLDNKALLTYYIGSIAYITLW